MQCLYKPLQMAIPLGNFVVHPRCDEPPPEGTPLHQPKVFGEGIECVGEDGCPCIDVLVDFLLEYVWVCGDGSFKSNEGLECDRVCI
jgi:hypothetical protein